MRSTGVFAHPSKTTPDGNAGTRRSSSSLSHELLLPGNE